MVKYSYYPGNVARQSSYEVEDTIQPLCKTLGIELFEIVGYNSDGGTLSNKETRTSNLLLMQETLLWLKRMAITSSQHALQRKVFFMKQWKLSETIQSPLQTQTQSYPRLVG